MSDIPPPHSTKVTMLKTASQRRSSLEEGSTRGPLCLAHAGHDAMNFSFTSMQRDKAQFQRPIIRSCHIRPEDRALSLVPSLPCDRAHAAVCPVNSRGQPSAALRPPRISRRLNYIAHVANKLSNCMDLQKTPLLPAYLNPSLQINTWKKKIKYTLAYWWKTKKHITDWIQNGQFSLCLQTTGLFFSLGRMNLIIYMSSAGLPNRGMLDLKCTALAEVFFSFSTPGWRAVQEISLTDGNTLLKAMQGAA